MTEHQAPAGTVDFSQVTERPSHKATREQLAMILTRYRFAREFVAGREVLEIACGAGLGLGYLARTARCVLGIDIDPGNLEIARQRYAGRPQIRLELVDAHRIPHDGASYDVVVLFDSIYFLRDAPTVLREAVRVLRPGGTLLVSTVNHRWDGFNPSPQAVRYYGGEEVLALLGELGCEARAFGAFPTRDSSMRAKVLSYVRRIAVALHLIPTSVRHKEILKRLVMGRLRELGGEVADGMAQAEPVQPVPAARAAGDDYKILYFAATKHS